MDKRFLQVDGDRLRELREARALSLRELGDLSGVAFDNINKMELGRRQGAQPRTVRRLANALGVDPSELQVRQGK